MGNHTPGRLLAILVYTVRPEFIEAYPWLVFLNENGAVSDSISFHHYFFSYSVKSGM
jgi:hypothetical protein